MEKEIIHVCNSQMNMNKQEHGWFQTVSNSKTYFERFFFLIWVATIVVFQPSLKWNRFVKI